MKKLVSLFIFLFSLSIISSCNVFDWADPNIDALDRCKSLNDSGDYEGAIAACNDADPDGTNPDAQIEIADASLAAVGIDLKTLSDIFLQKNGGTDTIVSLANGIIAKGRINKDNATVSKKYVQDAVDAFDKYGALLGSSTEDRQVAVFYAMLSRICQVATLMAYADIGSAVPNGDVTLADICNPDEPTCAASSPIMCVPALCVTSACCDGMASADAGVAADAMLELVDLIDSGVLPSKLDTKAVSDMVNTEVPDPDTATPVTIKDLVATKPAYKPDAGRRILFEIVK